MALLWRVRHRRRRHILRDEGSEPGVQRSPGPTRRTHRGDPAIQASQGEARGPARHQRRGGGLLPHGPGLPGGRQSQGLPAAERRRPRDGRNVPAGTQPRRPRGPSQASAGARPLGAGGALCRTCHRSRKRWGGAIYSTDGSCSQSWTPPGV